MSELIIKKPIKDPLTIDELIEALTSIKNRYGGECTVTYYYDGWDMGVLEVWLEHRMVDSEQWVGTDTIVVLG